MAKILMLQPNGRIHTRYFNEDTDISILLKWACDYAFRIPEEEDRKLWNTIIDKDWAELDDVDYYSYNKPYCYNGKWHSEHNGNFYDNFSELIDSLLVAISAYKKIEKLNDSL